MTIGAYIAVAQALGLSLGILDSCSLNQTPDKPLPEYLKPADYVVFEARLSFDRPKKQGCMCGVSMLTRVDLAASKILANSDRGMDRSTFSRDLIDLSIGLKKIKTG